MNADPTAFSAGELLRLYRQRKLSPVEVARAVLDRIGRFERTVNAFCLVDEERALAAARASEARWHRGEPAGLVDGVPTTIKDVVLTRDWPTLRGSLAVAQHQTWNEDAPATARLREQGAVLLGKTTTPEFGWKAVTDSPLSGITRNPWDVSRTPGGSSGGAAAAAALGMGALHVGSDGGGSIRIPASFTGVFGHKPSFGRVPAHPLSPFGTIAHIGPMTRTVADAALMLNVLAMPDARDWFALPHDGRDYRIGLEDGVRGLRIAFSPTLGFARVLPEVAELVAKAVTAFAEQGAVVEEVDPGFADPYQTFTRHWYAGAASLLGAFSAEQRALMEPGLREIAAEGERITLSDYLRAVGARAVLGQKMSLFHEHYDLLLTPTLPIPAFEAGREVPEDSGMKRWIEWAPFSNPFNLTQQPAASVPCGLTAAGLPVGLQIVGRMHDDALVLRAARAFEAAQPWAFPDAPKEASA
jgi:aspartyl-tRNA(Asn)/glutamyl-tRNA(Gln) amidotransferase subunit A